MTEWKQYRRISIAEMTHYVIGMDMTGVSITEVDKNAGSPTFGDMIARNPRNYDDKWLVAESYFLTNFEPIQ